MKLVLVGAGDHGRGTLEILRARAAAGLPAPTAVGFVDDDPATAGRTVGGLPVLGPVEWLVRNATYYAALLAIASPPAKQALAARLEPVGLTWENAVHPSAILGSGVTVGPGAIIGAGVVVAHDTVIGTHTTLNLNATVGHDCVIGSCSTIAPGVNITGRVWLGAGCLVQTNATIVPGLVLGDGAEIGPATLVLRDVPPGAFVFGNPGRRMPRPEPAP